MPIQKQSLNIADRIKFTEIAVKNFNKAIELNPQSAYAYLDKGVALEYRLTYFSPSDGEINIDNTKKEAIECFKNFLKYKKMMTNR